MTTNESKLPAVEANIHVHLRGRIVGNTATIDGGRSKYAVLSAEKGSSGITLFPDAAALDSLIDEAVRVRNEIAEHARRNVRRVTRLGDDSPTPTVADVIGTDPEDAEYVFVRWVALDGQRGNIVREAFDELTPLPVRP